MKSIKATDKESLELLVRAVEQATDSIVITDAAGHITHVNPAFLRVTGYTREEVVGKNPRVLKSGKHDAAFYTEMWGTLHRGEVWKGRLVNRRKDGSLYEEEATISPITDAEGRVTHFLAVKRDVTRERSLESQLIQAQKMEAIGRIAGGIAHDFNNLLTSIIGSAQLLSVTLPPGTAMSEDAQIIIGAGQRAAALTRQLLIFSRHDQIQKVDLNLAAAVVNIEKMLRRTVSEEVRLVVSAAPTPLWIRADAGYIDQVMLNLVVNARDAMPDGGKLTVSASARDLAAPFQCANMEVPAGRYVVLSISDTGTGIQPDVLQHLFEPFFTTKSQGKGTGLGLSTVYGIVKKCDGHICVETAPGLGTTFTVFFPMISEPVSTDVSTPVEARGGLETIMIVEDDDGLKKMLRRGLEASGYCVLTCGSAEEALEVAAAHEGKIDLLLTDVVLTGAAGPMLAQLLRRSRPEIKVLFISGYPLENQLAKEMDDPSADFLRKPFRLSDLKSRLRRSLDEIPG